MGGKGTWKLGNEVRVTKNLSLLGSDYYSVKNCSG